MSFFKVIVDIREYYTREPEEDEWDNGETAADISIQGVEFAERYFDVALPQEYVPGPLYLLYANFDTGDSFGRQRNKFEAVDIFQDRARAEAAQRALTNSEEGNASYVRDDGSTIQYSCPWHGYFESLNYLELEEVAILGHDNSVAMQQEYGKYEAALQKDVLEEELKDTAMVDKHKRKM